MKMARRLPGDRVLHETLLGLHDYAAMHFQREEVLQRACAYPLHEAHKLEHQQLLAEIKAMARSYFIDKTKQVSKETL
ncbi:MAG: hemerythrin, partial [Rhodospirillaceae bacterium]|nr:hemerythrin [Rhodospirillaceae bacterium]